MLIKKAVDLYTGADQKPRVNCAQAIVQAFKEKFGLSDEFVSKFSNCGSGQAPNGVCGALYAGQMILKQVDEKKIARLDQGFDRLAGSLHCKDIRKLKKLPCVECVKNTARILNSLT